jgi:cbb3-type cytochrome oxidase maturation protein
MEILYILVPLSLIFIALAIAIFGWAVKSGQYDDLEGPAHSILFDDDDPLIPGQEKTKAKTETPQTPSND